MDIGLKVAVVIPSYKVCNHILEVIELIGQEVNKIYIVDDFCPDNSGVHVKNNCKDKRVKIIRNMQNLGVGGAMKIGYNAAIKDGMDIIVKIDGDGQMDPSYIKSFVDPIALGQADYTKGNRFFDIEKIRSMPKIRLIGNAILSFMTKLSSGYWDLFDPTNGFTAIHRNVLLTLPLNKISTSYFFETDMLFRLNTLRAVVVDIPMNANYGHEKSNLEITKIIGEFFAKHMRNFLKRIFYNYYLRDMSLASIEFPLGLALFIFGAAFGIYHWVHSWQNESFTSAGTAILSALPIIIGIQFILAFLAYDISTIPKKPIHPNIKKTKNSSNP